MSGMGSSVGQRRNHSYALVKIRRTSPHSEGMRLARHVLVPLGLLFGFASCGPTGPQHETCSAARCFTGCCADGVCVGGQLVTACGTAGNSCEACAAGAQCLAGRCTQPLDAGCSARSDAALCAELGRSCGPLHVVDECQVTRDIASCGSCPTAMPCNTSGTCGCTAETDAQLCAAAGASCGALQVTDRCGVLRTITSCGGCASNQSCSGGRCSCVPETNAQLCQAAAKNCGVLSTVNRCGMQVTVASCGSCSAPAVCSSSGQCTCTTETDAQFCTRLGRACGSLTGTDNCGRSRTVASCGTCVGTNTCSAGVCACASETNSAFCQRAGATCGAVSGTDLCGNPKSVANCGNCPLNSTCGGTGTPNTCGCTPQSDAALCTSRGKECGSLTATDNCGVTRTATCPGTCTAPSSCGGGGLSNVCGCTSETSPQFCQRLGKTCGTVTANDNCGVSRTTSCGSCFSPQTCGGSGVPNTCGCGAETDAQFCARAGKNCGTWTGVDNCNQSRGANCGMCAAFTTCGGGGTTNVCGGRSEPMQPVCGQGFCWDNPLPVGADLRAAKTSPSGANWVVGDNGTALKWDGSTWRGWFALVPNRLNAVWPSSDTDVWAVGAGGTIIHFDGTTWSPVASGTTNELNGVWVSDSGTAWVVGAQGLVLQRPANGTFAALAVPSAAQTATLRAVYGIGTDVWVVGTQFILRWTQATGTWATTTTSFDLKDVWGASPTDLWAVSSSGVMRYTGTTWAESSSARGMAVTGTSATNVWVTSVNQVYRFDGVSWSSQTISAYSTTFNGVTARAADGTALAVGTGGALYRFDGSSWVLITKGASRQTYASSLTITDVYRSSAATTLVGYVNGNFGSTPGAIITCTGSPCTVASSPRNLVSVGGSTTSSVWALDSYTAYNRSGATVPALPSGPSYRAIAPISNTEVWVVGEDRTVRLQNGAWTTVPNPVGGSSTVLYGVSAWLSAQVWASGTEGTLLRFDGTSWAAVASGTTENILKVRATGPTTAFGGGAFGVISCSNSGCTPTAQTASVRGLWAESPSVFYVIENGRAKQWSGGVATNLTPWVTDNVGLALTQIAGSGGKVVVAGAGGELLHQQ
jgi:hypothetical protein